MIITRLTLHNFGVYAGENTFEFHSEKPVVLIGGMNGRGKTTFLDAVLLALYGPNSFAYSESKYKSYGQYLKSYVNTADGSFLSYIELEFKLDNDTSEAYRVRRQWSGKGQRIHEAITVYRDGEENTFLTDNWPMFVENILPSGLSNFFFFDGEKIAELALDSTNTQMKESIKSLLGISILDLLENDIGRIITKVTKNAKNAGDAKTLEKLKQQKQSADAELQALDDHLSALRNNLSDTEEAIERTKEFYNTHGGDIISQHQDLFNKRTYLTASIDQKQEQLLLLAGGDLPLILVSALLKQIQEQADREHESKALDHAVSILREMQKLYVPDAGEEKSSDSISQFIEFVEEQAEAEHAALVFNLSEQALSQLNGLLASGLSKSQSAVKEMMHSRECDQKAVDEIESYLSIDIDERSLAKTYKKIKKLEQQAISIAAEIEAACKKRSALNGEAIRANSEYRKFVESYLSHLEMRDDQDRIIKYSHQALDILNEYKIRLQQQKLGVLASTMTECYKKLANKKRHIEHIELDDSTLDFAYFDYSGNIIPNSSLSAGERQLMVISLLWALAICSKKELPVIIDTPLSRMDSNHRVALITTYFPQASKQTIILSTDSEIDMHYYAIMKDNVGDEFTLVYDDVQKCSTIRRGYFTGESNGDQTN